MIIISWDVGVIYLAYCVLKYDGTNVDLIDWDDINLLENCRIKLQCCGEMKAKKGEEPEICDKQASFCLNIGKKSYGYCKTHLAQHEKYWSERDTIRLFKPSNQHSCSFIKRTGDVCGKVSKFVYNHENTTSHYCTAHYKSELNKKIKEFSPQPIKNMIVRKYPTSVLQLKLVKKLDSLVEHFSKLGIEEVIIENQPAQKNPKMKAIASTIFDYFLIRGYIDKRNGLDISNVRFICPSNKLKVNNKNTLEVFKANKNDKKKYKLTKDLGIKYTKQLLAEDEEQLEYLDLHKKQDDMCDAYLQGRYYLEKDNIQKANKIANSKSAKSTKSTKSAKSTKSTKMFDKKKSYGGSKSIMTKSSPRSKISKVNKSNKSNKVVIL